VLKDRGCCEGPGLPVSAVNRRFELEQFLTSPASARSLREFGVRPFIAPCESAWAEGQEVL
jgi:hypothetical protein